MMENLLQDLRYGFRMMGKNRMVTFTAIIALALGIGANTAIFSLVNAMVLRPLPYENPERIVLLAYSSREASPANFLDWRSQSQTVENISAINFWNANLSNVSEPERLQGFQVSPSLFSLLGVKAVQGRTFLPEEEQPGKENVILISHGLWQRRFGLDPNVVGKTVSLNAKSYTVVGIMPADFQFYRPADVWAPLSFTPQDAARRAPGNLIVAGGLKPNVTLPQAQAEMTTISRRLEIQYPETNTGIAVNLVTLHDNIVGSMRPALLILLVAVLFVLLIACANVANLLLARAGERQKEMAVRIAVGASRWRVVRQLLTESVLLGLVGGTLGLLLAMWGIKILVAGIPQGSLSALLPAGGIGIDYRVLLFTLFISVLTSVVFGLAPALQISKPHLNETLKEGGRGNAGSFGRSRLRSLLVVSEVSLSLVLLIGAGLMINSFRRLLDTDPGFKPANVLTMQVSLLQAKYTDDNQVNNFFKQTLEQVKNLPGIQSVGATSNLPLGGSNKVRAFEAEGRAAPAPGQETPSSNYRIVSPDYFKALNIPLVSGRPLADTDTMDAPPVVLVNSTFANRYWPNGEAVGKRIRRFSAPGQPPLPWMQIIGVVGDIRHNGLAVPPSSEMYVPFTQGASRDLTLVMNTGPDPKGLASIVRAEINRVDKDQPVYNVKTMDEVISESAFLNRFSMSLLGIFAALALILAAVGIYSVMSYSVIQRSHEIGIRMALGASPLDVLKLIIRQGIGLTLAGVVIGVVVALGLTRFLSSLLVGVNSSDLKTFAGTALLLVIVAFIASYFPARRATRIDPSVALRYD
jgi:putative ABC transport system permease protein